MNLDLKVKLVHGEIYKWVTANSEPAEEGSCLGIPKGSALRMIVPVLDFPRSTYILIQMKIENERGAPVIIINFT